MLDHARTIREISAGVTFHQYINSKILQLAVERALEIIGEASKNISDDFKNKHPGIPWRGIAAQRNVIAHEYGEIRQERLWIVVTERIPSLISQLEQLGLTPP